MITISEHHSNLVCWQQVAKAKGGVLKYLYLNDDYTLDWEEVERKITDQTKIVSIAQMSNVLGTIYPVQEIAAYAHTKGVLLWWMQLRDAAHMPTMCRYLMLISLFFRAQNAGTDGDWSIIRKKRAVGNDAAFSVWRRYD